MLSTAGRQNAKGNGARKTRKHIGRSASGILLQTKNEKAAFVG